MRLGRLVGMDGGGLARDVSATLLRDLSAGRAMPTDAAHRAIVARLDEALGRRLAALERDPGLRARLLEQLAAFDWLEVDRIHARARVEPARLLAYALDRATGRIYAADGELHLVLEFGPALRDFAPLELCRQVRPSRFGVLLRRFVLKTLREGCTELVLRLPAASVAEALELFLAGELEPLGIVTAYADLPRDRGWRDGPAESFTLAAADTPARLEQRWRQACRRQPLVSAAEETATSLDLLAALAAPGYRCLGTTRRVLRASAEQFLAAPRFKPGELIPIAWRGYVQWPLLAAALLAGAGWLFQATGQPVALGFGALFGLALSFVGSVNCAFCASPLAGAGGAVGLTVVFGLTAALIAPLRGGIAALAQALAECDPFVAVVGGISGAEAPLLLRLPAWSTATVLLATGAAIVWSGWVMLRPHGERPAVHTAAARPWLGGVLGAGAGGGIAAIYAASGWLGAWWRSPALGFTGAFLCIGGAATAFSVWLASGSRRQALRLGLLHGAMTLGGASLLFFARGRPIGLVLGGMATGFFHATFFMTALMIGWALGGRRAAVVAAGLEGAGGYLGFVVSRMLS
jgi:hypothetical protein